MARVNVEQKALTDPRFTRLGMLLDVPIEYAQHVGLSLMVRVWNECQERGSYHLTESVLDAIFARQGSGKFLVDAELARVTKRGKFYIAGSKGRVEWLKKRREDGKKGGRPKKTLRLPLGGDGPSNPRGGPGNNPPAPAPAPAQEKKPRGKAAGGSAFQRWARETWGERHGGADPGWGRGEYVALAEVEKQLGDEEARARWRRFLGSDDPFLVKRGRRPVDFRGNLGAFVAPRETKPPPVEPEDPATTEHYRRMVRAFQIGGVEGQNTYIVACNAAREAGEDPNELDPDEVLSAQGLDLDEIIDSEVKR